MKIKMKNFMFTTIIIVIVVTIAFGLLYIIMPKYYEERKKDELYSKIDIIVEKIKDNPLSEKNIEYLKKEQLDGLHFYEILDENGKTLFPMDGTIVESSVVIQEETVRKIAEKNSQKDNNVKYGQEEGTIFLIETPMSDVDHNFLKYQQSFTGKDKKEYIFEAMTTLQPVTDAKFVLLEIYPWILLMSFIIGSIGAFFYSHFSTKKIKKISQVTEAMTSLKEDITMDVAGKDELSELATSINYLYSNLLTTIQKLNGELEKTSETERSKAEFMRIASHELKTPITAMTGIVEGMIYQVGEFADRDRYLKECQKMLQEQTKLVKDIIYVSGLEMMSKEDKVIEKVNMHQLLVDLLPTYTLLAKTKGYQVHVDVTDVELYIAKDDIEKVIANLLSNAMNYTRENGHIFITLTEEQFIIENECVPLEEHEQEKIFQAFYRPDYARSKKDGGTGLGLFIVSQLLDTYGLPYMFSTAKGIEGMSFKIELKNHSHLF